MLEVGPVLSPLLFEWIHFPGLLMVSHMTDGHNYHVANDAPPLTPWWQTMVVLGDGDFVT